jgi:hypothetical protein
VGVECTTCADGMALHVTLSVRCAVALPPSGCFFDQGVTTFWRRGVAYGSPMEIVPAEFSTRSLSSPPCRPVRVFERIANHFPVLPLLLGGRDWLPWTPTRAAADPGWPHLSGIRTRDETASRNGLLPPCW